MKKFFAIVSLFVAGYNVAEAQSMLKVNLTDNSQINIALDNRYFNKRGASVTVGDLPPGRHTLEIYATYQDNQGRTQEQIVYTGRIKTTAGVITLFQYDPANDQKSIQQQDMDTYTSNNFPQNNGGNSGNNDQNMNNEQAPPQDNGNNGNGYDNNSGGGSVASPAPVSSLTEEKADKLKTAVEKKVTDTEKLKTLKDGLKGETLTTDQVSGMMDWFSFEDSKVDFAKWAYNVVVDKDDYRSLENKFSYKASQDALETFIGK